MDELRNCSAIVLGGEVNGLAVIRSLGRLGIRVAAVHAAKPGDPARYSRYPALTGEVSVDATDEVLLQAISDCAGRVGGHRIVLIPTTDRFSELLAAHEPALRPDFVVCNPQAGVCEAFLDKWSTAELCRKHGVLIPATACPTGREQLDAAAASMNYPVIVKPRLTFGTGFPGKNAVFSDAGSLRGFFQDHDLLGKCVVQEIIPSGDGDVIVTAAYSGTDGSVRAIYSGRKLRQYLPDYGATCFGVSERHPELELATRRLLDSIRYRGFSALEFARSRTDGKHYFLELNTRTYYHNQLFSDAGVDLTQIGFVDAVGLDYRSVIGVPVQREGLVWLDFRRDFQSMRIKRRAGRITLSSWFISLFSASSFAVWNSRDPLPFLASCAHRVADLFARLWRRTIGRVLKSDS